MLFIEMKINIRETKLMIKRLRFPPSPFKADAVGREAKGEWFPVVGCQLSLGLCEGSE